MRREAVRQVQAPAYKFDGKIAAHGINDRWFCDLVDFTAAPSDRGKRTGLGETKEGEVYILVVQDVFSRYLWTEAFPYPSETYRFLSESIAKSVGLLNIPPSCQGDGLPGIPKVNIKSPFEVIYRHNALHHLRDKENLHHL